MKSAATPDETQRIEAILREYDITICPMHRYPQLGQTRALGTLRRIRNKHGVGHLRLVLSTLAETTGAAGLIDEVSLWAVSDLLRASSDIVERDPSAWLDAWDGLPLGRFMALVNDLRGIASQRFALVGICYVYLRPRLDKEEPVGRRQRPKVERIAIGRELLRLKDQAPSGTFRESVQRIYGLNEDITRRYMKQARATTPEKKAKIPADPLCLHCRGTKPTLTAKFCSLRCSAVHREANKRAQAAETEAA